LDAHEDETERIGKMIPGKRIKKKEKNKKKKTGTGMELNAINTKAA
jgi:hypothetical protein